MCVYIYICRYTIHGFFQISFLLHPGFSIKTAWHLQCPGRTWVNPQRDMAAHDVDTKSRVGPPTRAVGWSGEPGCEAVGMPRMSWLRDC